MTLIAGKGWKQNRRAQKFGNVRVTNADGTFDSQKEHRRWCELKLLERGGVIRNLERQTRFDIVINGVNCGFWKCDFSYFADNARVIEDVKSSATAEDKYWRFKKKILEAVFGFEIREII
jgi:hypothetical protein